jgi:tRNA dimethylallyltransferase
MIKSKYNLISIIGPTASGKTAFAAKLAGELNGEIISADSRQVYRRMDIGTGKDIKDYVVNGRQIPFHLVDIAEPGYKYSVFEYQQDFVKAFQSITAKGKMPLLCGGTGMYIEAVINGYRLLPVPPDIEFRRKLKEKSLDELTLILSGYKKLHNISDVDSKERAIRAIEIEAYYADHPETQKEYPAINPVFIGIRFDREEQRDRITRRLQERLKGGMVEEVQRLLDEGILLGDLIYYGLEYKYITQYLTGELEYGEMVSRLNIAIHQFAKRQMTWFRKMEKAGSVIHWLDGDLTDEEKVKRSMRIILG